MVEIRSRRSNSRPTVAPHLTQSGTAELGTPPSIGGKHDVVSLIRGLSVLEALAAGTDDMSPQQLVQTTGLNRSGVQRILRTLLRAGYVRRAGRGRYAVGARGLSLGYRLAGRQHMATIAAPLLLELSRRVGETVNLAILDGTEVVYIARFATEQILSVNLEVGSRLPAYCTSLGRAILGHLPAERAREVLERSDRRQVTPKTMVAVSDLMTELGKVRAHGYAQSDQQLELGLRSIAVPVFGPSADAIAAINVSMPAARFSLKEINEQIAPPLREAGRALSNAVGFEE